MELHKANAFECGCDLGNHCSCYHDTSSVQDINSKIDEEELEKMRQ